MHLGAGDRKLNPAMKLGPFRDPEEFRLKQGNSDLDNVGVPQRQEYIGLASDTKFRSEQDIT